MSKDGPPTVDLHPERVELRDCSCARSHPTQTSKPWTCCTHPGRHLHPYLPTGGGSAGGSGTDEGAEAALAVAMPGLIFGGGAGQPGPFPLGDPHPQVGRAEGSRGKLLSARVQQRHNMRDYGRGLWRIMCSCKQLCTGQQALLCCALLIVSQARPSSAQVLELPGGAPAYPSPPHAFFGPPGGPREPAKGMVAGWAVIAEWGHH